MGVDTQRGQSRGPAIPPALRQPSGEVDVAHFPRVKLVGAERHTPSHLSVQAGCSAVNRESMPPGKNEQPRAAEPPETGDRPRRLQSQDRRRPWRRQPVSVSGGGKCGATRQATRWQPIIRGIRQPWPEDGQAEADPKPCDKQGSPFGDRASRQHDCLPGWTGSEEHSGGNNEKTCSGSWEARVVEGIGRDRFSPFPR